MTASLIFVFIVSSISFDSGNSQNLTRPQATNDCLLPPYPEHGRYAVSDYPSAKPGERYPSVLLDVSCDTGYRNINTTSIFCVNGYWSAAIPECVRVCKLVNNLSVEYHCVVSGPGSLKGRRECDSLVPPGTDVTPICSSPGYFSRKPLEQMHCINGSWNYNPICERACGITTQHRQLEGTSTNHLELPWHAIIYQYKKVSEDYVQICGGSLISSNTVISAARCFWRDLKNLLPVSDYAVAVGKLYSPYKGTRDKNAQQSNVINIRIPPSYEESAPNYQDDIAIVLVEKPFQFLLSVQPICLDFDDQFNRTQLTRRSSGKAVGWKISGKSDPVLTVVDLPYLTFEDCTNISTYFRKYITRDHFCARSNHAARCFWRDLKNLLPVSDYAVAVGKLYSPYKGTRDKNAQQSNVINIRIPPSYEESAPNYQDDIAIVLVEKPFQFLLSVQPICLDFDDQFNRTQLTRRSSGKAVGWKISGKSDPVLTVVDLPYLTFEDCTNISTYFRKYITRDHFCARSNHDSSLCRGDVGGGFAVLEPTTQRYYLRSVISGVLVDEDLYDCFTINTYSSILKHEQFIKQFL